MTRAQYRFVKWKLAPDTEPDAAPITHRLGCDVCCDDARERGCEPQDGLHSSPAVEAFSAAQEWVFQHVREFPDHYSYTETITRPWRATPT